MQPSDSVRLRWADHHITVVHLCVQNNNPRPWKSCAFVSVGTRSGSKIMQEIWQPASATVASIVMSHRKPGQQQHFMCEWDLTSSKPTWYPSHCLNWTKRCWVWFDLAYFGKWATESARGHYTTVGKLMAIRFITAYQGLPCFQFLQHPSTHRFAHFWRLASCLFRLYPFRVFPFYRKGSDVISHSTTAITFNRFTLSL